LIELKSESIISLSNSKRERTKIIVPTPALSEVLVRAGSEVSDKIIEHLQRFTVFRIEPFDTRAAIEVAAMTRDHLTNRQGKRGTSSATWTKIKFDRQIVAIAKVHNATAIYSDDEDIGKIAARAKIKVIGLSDLPLPPEDAQLTFVLTGAAEGAVQRSGDDVEEQGTPA
jgi:predicted nucleic acid-binding protein